MADKNQEARDNSFLVQGDSVHFHQPQPWRSSYTWLIAFAILVAAVVLIVIGTRALGGSSDDGDVQVAYQAADFGGKHPFLPNPPAEAGAQPIASTPAFPAPTGGKSAGGIQISGGEPGVYGGLQDQTTGGTDAIVGFYENHPPERRALIRTLTADPTFGWAGGEALSEADLPNYLRGLTAVVLRLDIRVTDHEYRDGKVTAFETVLQRGTSVLVDTRGVPRLRSLSGSPLTVSTSIGRAPEYTGTAWTGFDPAAIIIMVRAPNPLAVFTLVDIDGGKAFERPAGSCGTKDREAKSAVPTMTGSASSQTPSSTGAPTVPTTAVTPTALDVSGTWILESMTNNSGTGTVTVVDGGFRFHSDTSGGAAPWECLLPGRPGQQTTMTCTLDTTANGSAIHAEWKGEGTITSIQWAGRTMFRFDGITVAANSLAGMPMTLRPA
ncbi:DUF6777 domain-containing protein [Nocardia yamanashiensis]|uniref:DUF6777 domain-containing protein n=1 Tax=Nocardia yamanashiensis TaxID=209247 RepID=UPI00082E3666|nr:DUF6777 domain-containing protein [Nocardia yamanashiensis]